MAKRARKNKGESNLGGSGHEGDLPSDDSGSILEGTSAEQTMVEDPLFVFLQKNWRPLAVVAAVVGVAWYMNMVFQENYVTSMRAAADVFANMRSEFSTVQRLGDEKSKLEIEIQELTKKPVPSEIESGDTTKDSAQKDEGVDAAKLDEKKKRLDELAKEMNVSKQRLLEFLRGLDDLKEPYSSLSQAYRGLLSAEEGDLQKAVEFLGEFKWERIDPSDKAARFVSEMAALRLARVYLDMEDKQSEARTLLKNLSENGLYVNVSAALALSRSSSGKEELNEALMLLEEISSNHSEQAELVEPEVERLRNLSS